nr:14716_t:CDS:10 [Entrophospora candida]
MQATAIAFGRSAWKGPYFVKFPGLKEAMKNNLPVKTQARSCTILPTFVGLKFLVHNGKDYVPVNITEDMIGHKLGEFSVTRKKLMLTEINLILPANNGCWYHYYLPKFLNPSNNDNSERLLFTNDNEYLSVDWAAENFLKLSSEEKMIIENGYVSLAKFEKKSDCFKKAIGNLKHGCSEINLSETIKIQFAIHLTKCEIATANLLVPMECQDFDREIGNNEVGKCVESLSRTPQLWTSYSGYFREVFHICFAVRYSVEKDLLEELHRNITKNQLFNYKILRNQQSEMIELRKEELKRLKMLEKFQSDILKNVNEIEQLSIDTESFKGNLNNSRIIIQDILKYLFEFIEEFKTFQTSVKETFKEFNAINNQQLEIINNVMEQEENLEKINVAKFQEISTQENQEFMKQLHQTLNESKLNLLTFLNSTQNEIKLFNEILIDSKEHQKDLINIFKPLVLISNIMNWFIGGDLK